MTESKIILWDLETTGLRADMYEILSFHWGYWEPGVNSDESWYFTQDGTGDDKLLCAAAEEVLNAPNVVGWITHFGMYFDIPYLNTRLAEWKLPPLRKPQTQIRHTDTWHVAKKNLKLSNNRLDRLAKFLDVPHRKTVLDYKIWRAANKGDKKSLAYIYDHGAADVVVLREVMNRLVGRFPFIISQAAIHENPKMCPHCGHDEFALHKWYYNKVTRKPQFRCRGCKGFFSGKTEPIKRGATFPQ